MDPLYFYIPNQSGMGGALDSNCVSLVGNKNRAQTLEKERGKGKEERRKKERRAREKKERQERGKGKEVSIVLLYFSPLFSWPKGLYSRRRSGRGAAREMSGRNSIGENCSDSSYLLPQSLFLLYFAVRS